MQTHWKIVWGLVSIGLVLIAFSIPCSVVFAQPSAKWIMTFGDSGHDVFYAAEVDDDGYVLAGITESSGFGPYDPRALFDAWLIKTDSNGAMEWNQTYGGSLNDIAYSLIPTSDGGYALAGGTRSNDLDRADVWLIKTDSFGNMEWNQTYGGSLADRCYSLVTTSDGGYALLCQTFSFGIGECDVWLIKVDSLGNMEWNQTYGGSGYESVSTIIATNDGGYALAGSTQSFGAGSSDFWLIKVDSLGNMEWNQTYGSPEVEFANSLVTTIDGGYALAGSTNTHITGNADVWLVKVDSQGNLEWNQTYGGPIADYCDAMVVSSNGDYTLAGFSQEPIQGDGDIWLINVDSLGNMLWNQTYGLSAHHSQASLLATVDGSYILGASTRDDIGNHDFWLAKIAKTNTSSELLIYLLIPVLVVLALIAIIIVRRTKNSQKHHIQNAKALNKD
jgi:hypothetical protein